MTRFQIMKKELAEKLAAADAGVELETAQMVIDSYLEALKLCPACNGTKMFTYRREVAIQTRDSSRSQELVHTIPGTTGECPQCGSDPGDPEWVVWLCYDRFTKCRSDSPVKDHDQCRWVVAIPWE
jgi:phage FluMu protein Com